MFASHFLKNQPGNRVKSNPWSKGKPSKSPKPKKSPEFVEFPLGYPKDFPTKTKSTRRQSSSLTRISSVAKEDVSQEVQDARDTIVNFFVDQSKAVSITSLLEQFNVFFLDHEPDKVPLQLSHSTYQLLVYNRKTDFIYLLNRCAFLIVATGLKQKKMGHIKQLLALFQEQPALPSNASLAKRQFRQWSNSYQTTKQYSLLKMFVPHLVSAERPWSERYMRFALLAHTLGDGISPEERYSCEFLYQALKSRYKFQLVMYVTKGYEAPQSDPASVNPTLLTTSTLKLIRKILLAEGQSYVTATESFLQGVKKESFADFKAALVDDVFAPMAGDRRLQWLPQKLSQYLMELHPEKDNVEVGRHLIKKTCNDLISYLLNPKSFVDPTHPFTLLMIQREYLSLSLMLLRLILISPQSYAHLMVCLNDLMNDYSDKPEADCQWLIGLLETIQVIMTLAINGKKSKVFSSAV